MNDTIDIKRTRGSASALARRPHRRRGRRSSGRGGGALLATAREPGVGVLAMAIAATVVLMVAGGSAVGMIVIGLLAVLALGLAFAAGAGGAMATLRDQNLAIRIGLIGIAILPLLQLIPLPPGLWQALPDQLLRARTLALAGIADSWQPLTLTPLATAGTAVMAITLVLYILVLLSLPAQHLRKLGWIVIGLIGLNLVIGVIQVATGGEALQFHRIADQGALIGFYANKNHAALVLAASIPIAAWLIGSRAEGQQRWTWVALYACTILIALITTNSRAGLGLGLLAAIAVGSLYIRKIRPAFLLIGLTIAGVAIVVISSTSAFETVFARFEVVGDDLRWEILQNSIPLIDKFWLLGSGFGGFQTVYAVHENLAALLPAYVNQMHNDYLQLLLEGGIPGVAVLVSIVAGITIAALSSWRSGSKQSHFSLICGLLILALIVIHSVIDYPLHRPAVLPVLAIGIVLTIRNDLARPTVSERKPSRTRAAHSARKKDRS